jgi:uncharacterized metal-binding protein YceD (DUF177 family)
MPVLVNLRQLKLKSMRLQGELPITELDYSHPDECLELGFPLKYDLEAQWLEESVLVQGSLQILLRCSCVRCLKKSDYRVELKNWVCQLGSAGEEKMVVVNDCVDLTSYLREDILLAFPQHPLCDAGCRGLPPSEMKGDSPSHGPKPLEASASPWDLLDKIKL